MVAHAQSLYALAVAAVELVLSARSWRDDFAWVGKASIVGQPGAHFHQVVGAVADAAFLHSIYGHETKRQASTTTEEPGASDTRERRQAHLGTPPCTGTAGSPAGTEGT